MESYCTRLKLLKVVKTPEAIAEMEEVMKFVAELETALSTQDSTLVGMVAGGDNKTAARLQHFRELAARRNASTLGRMKEIANDEKVRSRPST